MIDLILYLTGHVLVLVLIFKTGRAHGYAEGLKYALKRIEENE